MRLKYWFLLSVLCAVVLCQLAGAQQQPATVNLRQRAVASDPGVPEVRVIVDRRRVRLGTQVRFTVIPASIVHDRRYVVTLYFGDGQTQVMLQPEVPYLYQAVGNYTYSVSVKRSQPDPTPTPTPTPTPRPSPSPTPGVRLYASPVSVNEGVPVAFTAQVSPNYPNIQYRFAFGDGSSSRWQSSPQTQHTYDRAGNYSAYVDIGNSGGRIGGSARQQIAVRPSSISVSLTARPLPAKSGKPVNFIANASTPRPDTLYRFNFGDGSQTIWQADQRAQHTYKSGGSYRAYVDVTQSVNNQSMSAISSPTFVTVQSAAGPTPQPTSTQGSSPTPDSSSTQSPNASPSAPTLTTSPVQNATPSPAGLNAPNRPPGLLSPNMWPYLLLAALLLFLIYQASSYLFAVKPTFAPFADPGVAALADDKGWLPLDFQLVLNPNVSSGDYSVSTDELRLVKSADDFQERQIIEI